jgi:hypothetical protein
MNTRLSPSPNGIQKMGYVPWNQVSVFEMVAQYPAPLFYISL